MLITFTLLPSVLNILSNKNMSYKDQKKNLKLLLFSLKRERKITRKIIFSSALIVIIISIVGITKLEVENSFINYFNKETEIYKGMKLIDNKLGGTTPLNVIIKFPKKDKNVLEEDDDWGEEEKDESKYWFTRDKIDKITKVHDYLDELDSSWKSYIFCINS